MSKLLVFIQQKHMGSKKVPLNSFKCYISSLLKLQVRESFIL